MRILMLGNSFTFFHDLPLQLAELTGAEVVQHTRGGARLAEQLNPAVRMGKRTQEALEREKWDYVILQEMSNGPITARTSFMKSVEALSAKIRQAGAKPVLFATWAYKKSSDKMNSMKFSYDEMAQQLYDAYHEAAERFDCLVADVGKAFFEKADQYELYDEDGLHPSELGTKIAAEVIAEVLK